MPIRPIPARHYVNRVDIYAKSYSDDLEAGVVETPGVNATAQAVPCSVQSGVPIEAMDQSALQARADVLVYFPSKPPVGQNDVIVQVDVEPPLKLTVIDVQDVGGQGVIWCLPCSRLE